MRRCELRWRPAYCWQRYCWTRVLGPTLWKVGDPATRSRADGKRVQRTKGLREPEPECRSGSEDLAESVRTGS